MQNRKEAAVDSLEAMAGGYAPNAGTPTHFFGREATSQIICEANKNAQAHRRKFAAIKKAKRKRKVSTHIEYCKPAPGIIVAYEVMGAGDEHPYDEGEIAQTETPIDESGSSLTDVSIVGQQEETDEERERRLDEEDAWVNSPESYGPAPPQLLGQTNPGNETMNTEEQAMIGGEVEPGDDMMGDQSPMEMAPDMEIETGGKAQERGEIIDNTPGMAGYARRYPGMPERAEAIRHVMGVDEWSPEDEYPPSNTVPKLPGVKPDDGDDMSTQIDSFLEDQDYMGGDMIEESQQMANDGGPGSADYTGPETDSHFGRLLPQHLAQEMTPGEEREDEKEDQVIPPESSFEDAKASSLFW